MDKPKPLQISLGTTRLDFARILIGQPSWVESDWSQPNQLFQISNLPRATAWLHSFLGKARETQCTVVVLPELSVPESLVPIIEAWSAQTNTLVIAGSHYVQTDNGYISRCPIIFNGKKHFVEKIHPAPAEVSPRQGNALVAGKSLACFTNTPLGNFGVLICSDYLKDDVKKQLDISSLDVLFVVSFQKDSNSYYKRIDIDIEDHRAGIFIFYANNFLMGSADGHSALFGLVDAIYKKELASQLSDPKLSPQPLIDLNDGDDYVVVDIDLVHKKPKIPRTVDTRPNVFLIEHGCCFTMASIDILTHSFVPNDFLGVNEYSIESRIQAFCRKIIAKHGLNDDEWSRALSSMYFLVALAHDLALVDTDEYKALLDNFLAHFRLRHNDEIELLEDKILVTPEEVQHIRTAMEQEDVDDPYFTATTKTRAHKVDMGLMHKNYLYGVALVSNKLCLRIF